MTEDPLSKLLTNGVDTNVTVQGSTFYKPKEVVEITSIKMVSSDDVHYIVKLSDGKERDLIYDFQTDTVNKVIEHLSNTSTVDDVIENLQGLTDGK